jgi:hypothetical protein
MLSWCVEKEALMLTRSLKLSIFAVITFAVGTATAQTSPDPNAGAYGGNTYGGVAAPVQPTAEASPVVPEPAAEPAPIAQVETPSFDQSPAKTGRQDSLFERWGTAMALGLGVEGFTHGDDTGTEPGGGWNVRAVLGTKTMFGFEGSYIGSAQPIDAIGLDNSSVLVGNGAQGALRFNMTPQYDVGLLLIGGVAWRHYNLTNESFNTSDVQNNDDVLEIPIGAGLQYDFNGMLLDARVEYRFTNYGDMMGPTASSGSAMDRWGMQANAGYRF